MWECKNCLEQLEDSFDACWSCGYSSDGSEPRSPSHVLSEIKELEVTTKRRENSFLDLIAFFSGLVGLLFTANDQLGIGFLFGINTFIMIAISMSSDSKRDKENRMSEFEASCLQQDVTYKPNYSDCEREFFLGLSEKNAVLLVQHITTNNTVEKKLIKLSDIINIEFDVNDLSVYKGSSIDSLSAAAIGGLAFGGAGAIVGSLTSSNVGRGKISKATLKLRVNDIDVPLIEITFINESVNASSTEAQARLKIAEQWMNLIEVMRFRLAERKDTSIDNGSSRFHGVDAKSSGIKMTGFSYSVDFVTNKK